MFEEIRIVIKGAGDLATGVAVRLWRAGFPLVMTELPQPLTIRRTVAFAEAVFEGEAEIEGIRARRLADVRLIEPAWQAGVIPIIVSCGDECIEAIEPTVLVDAILAKRNTGTHPSDAPFVVGLGPGFVAGKDVHAVVETNRGHYLGRVLWSGSAEPDTGVPGDVGGYRRERVIHAPAAGVFEQQAEIGTIVKTGQVVGRVGGVPVLAPIPGVLRGLIHDGLTVHAGLKIGDVDPRAAPEHCYTISDKALAIGGGVLEAVLMFLRAREGPSGRRPASR